MPDADIYQGDQLVAHFERVPDGINLYFRPEIQLDRGILATSIPPVSQESRDLPAFFLNLLPEGKRLQLLLDSAQSRDDLLELLLRVGWDTIGDVSVVPHGQKPGLHLPLFSQLNLQAESFWDLFYEGIAARPDSTIPGAQEKISASTVAFGVRAATAPSAILKLNPPKYPRLVQNEHFIMRMAKDCRIRAAKTEVVIDRTGEFGLLVHRFDRVREAGKTRKLHQEDGCQLLNAVPAHKYHFSVREIADSIMQVVASPVVEIERLLRQIAFSYVIGNADLHAKNVSVLWQGVAQLSPAYDLLSTLPYPFLERNMALKLQGKDDNFRSGDFVEFGQRYGIGPLATKKMILELCDRSESWLSRLDEIGFDEKTTLMMEKEMRNRIHRLRRT